MQQKRKTGILAIIFPIVSVVALWCFPGCFTTDKYHNKRHIDTMKKDIDSAHKDIDRVFGLDEPSPLVDE